ncbi:hypothetical protein Tco_0184362 [Tanacetum coccineum]
MKTKRKLVPKSIGSVGPGNLGNNQNEGAQCIPLDTNVIVPVQQSFAEDVSGSKRRCIRNPKYVSSSNVHPESLNGSGQCVPLNTCLNVAGHQTLPPDVGGSKQRCVRQLHGIEMLEGDGQQLGVPSSVNEISSDMNVDAPDVQISLAQQPATNNSLGVSDSVSHSSVPLSAPRGFTEGTFQADNHTASSTFPSNYKSVGRCEHSFELKVGFMEVVLDARCVLSFQKYLYFYIEAKGRAKAIFSLNNCVIRGKDMCDGPLPQGWRNRCATTIIPPKTSPQIGEPIERKKCAAELADDMMKSKKLTKTGRVLLEQMFVGPGNLGNNQNEGAQCIPLDTDVIVPVQQSFAEDVSGSKRSGPATLPPDVGGSKRKCSHGLGNLNEDGQNVKAQQPLASDVGGSKQKCSHGLGNLDEDGQCLPLDRDVNIFGRQIPVEDVGGSKRSIRMEQYLTFTDHALWEVIVNGDSVTPVALASGATESFMPVRMQSPYRKQSRIAGSSRDKHLPPYEDDGHVSPSLLNQSNSPQLDNKDLEQIDTDDLEEMDLKRQMAMLTMRAEQAKEGPTDFALMSHLYLGSSSSLNSDTEVIHEKNEAVYEERNSFLKYDVQVKDISIKEIKNQLEKALKEKDDLTLKLERFETSSKKLTKMLNSQISANDKTGLGYNGQMNESVLNNLHVNKSEVLNKVDSVFDSSESDEDDNQVNDRFKKNEGYHAVPPPYTGNYMPPRADLSFVRLDDSVFKSKVNETTASESDSEDKNVFKPKEVKKTVKPSFEKTEFVNARNTTVEHEYKAEKPRKISQSSRGNKRKWNGLMTQRLGDGFEFQKKTYFGNPQYALQDQGIFDNGCSRHMTGNKSYLTDYQDIDGGFVAFAGSPKGGKIIGKGKIRTGKLDFEDVYFLKELKFNLFFVSQMCDKKNSVLITKTECLVLSPDFRRLDESQVLLKVPRQNNMYSFDLKNVVPSGGLTLFICKGYNRSSQFIGEL